MTTVLPAHGQPFHDLPGRAEEIKVHHDERLARLLEICDAAGWANVVDLSHELFAPRSWGSMAEAETFAHLERLRATGALQRREEAGILLYHLWTSRRHDPAREVWSAPPARFERATHGLGNRCSIP